MSVFHNWDISQPTLDKVREFTRRFNTTEGRDVLAKTGLSDRQIDAMMARADWFLTNCRFPPTI